MGQPFSGDITVNNDGLMGISGGGTHVVPLCCPQKTPAVRYDDWFEGGRFTRDSIGRGKMWDQFVNSDSGITFLAKRAEMSHYQKVHCTFL